MAGEILVAKVSASVIHGGRTIILTAGKTTVRAGHALLTGREHMFMPLHVDYDVEAAGEPGDDSGGEPEGALAQTMRASVAPDDTEAAPEDAESEPEQAPEPEPRRGRTRRPYGRGRPRTASMCPPAARSPTACTSSTRPRRTDAWPSSRSPRSRRS